MGTAINYVESFVFYGHAPAYSDFLSVYQAGTLPADVHSASILRRQPVCKKINSHVGEWVSEYVSKEESK